MNIHEYQAKALLKKYGIPTPNGDIAYTLEDVKKIMERLVGPLWVIKAQIHAGGRGAGYFLGDSQKRGGIRVVKSAQEVFKEVQSMLGQVLVTKQTGSEGKTVYRVYIEEGCKIEKEFYLAMLLDRTHATITLIASTEGGIAIEEVAAHTPEKILTIRIDPSIGIHPYHARRIAYGLGLQGEQVHTLVGMILQMYKMFIASDATLVEINPLVQTQDEQILALDAKMTFDDNSLFRHSWIKDMQDETERDEVESLAQKNDLSYVKLTGNIGCMVNGAGLAMATMDIIKLYGGEPANFLDVGGGATQEQVSTAFRLILSDSNVKGILINIFGGIMRCDVIAAGVIAAAQEVHLTVPLVVRLAGTNVALGKKLLDESGLPILAADHLNDAAQKIVQTVKGRESL